MVKKRKFIVVFILYFVLANATAQQFSRADSLRGFLSKERASFDVNYYDINLDISFDEQSISGYVEIHFKVLESFSLLQLDLFENMNIDSVIFGNQQLDFKREYNTFYVHLREALKKGESAKLKVYYNGKPIAAKMPPWDGGFVWRKTPSKEHWLGVAVQGDGASLWWPNKDHLSDEPDSVKVTCTYPSNLYFVGNGRKVMDEIQGVKRKTSWKVTYPINNYNVTLNIAPYSFFEENFKSVNDENLDLQYFVLPQNLNKARTHFQQVAPMMNCFEKYFGPYPFIRDGYKLVETPYLGMEHQSCVAYGNQFKSGYNGMDYSGIGLDFDFIIIHETGHEWWGNAVSVEDLADLWIHEGFCTYSEVLYVECLYGKEKALDYINFAKTRIQNEKPLIPNYGVNAQGPGDIYTKGAMLIHNIRYIVNDDEKFLGWIRAIVDTFSYKTTNTNELIKFSNSFFKQDLTILFNEFLQFPQLPVLQYKLNKKGNKFSYKWMANQPEFNMPINVNFSDTRLIPINKWKSLKIRQMDVGNVKVDQRNSYFNVELIN